MNRSVHSFKFLIAASLAALLLGGCSAGPTRPDGSENVRKKLMQLQADPELASRAPVAIKDAEVAVTAAEQPHDDKALERHLVQIADRKVDIATAQAQSRLSEDQRKALSEQRETARLDSRTREADAARGDANMARNQAAMARSDADSARSQAAAAGMATEAARQQADDLQRQIAELNAKATERGLIVTLGDVLFATGKSELKGGTPSNLGKLAAFLNQYPDRSVVIEGHTDNVGSDATNQGLSQRRADTVKAYLMRAGVNPTRVIATGLGEGSPVAGNETSTGRQQNRRVEVIIANPPVAAK